VSVDRCALFVDAGYLLADGALAVHGTRHREAVSWDFGGLLQLLGNLARERTGLPLLRCYWYEAAVEGRRSPEHEALADLPGLKLRLGRIRPGRREAVDTEIHRDLMTLARNGALADAIVVSNDEDLAQVISDAQDLGVRVTVLHIAAEGNWTIARALRQECDDLIEIGSGHLRPYVNLLTGVEASSLSSPSTQATPSSSLSNGHATGSGGAMAPLQTGAHAGQPPPSGQLSPSSQMGSGGQLSPSGQLGSGAHVGPPPHVEQQQQQHSQPQPQPSPASPMYAAPTPAPATTASQSPPAPAAPMPSPAHVTGSGSGYPAPMAPAAPPQHGPYTGPQQLSPAPAQQVTSTLSDAVKAAHQEGQDFGESVARDAPALWLEAVLARKPRMPSDLEARLLQGSSLPIDFLLHDEVRHALRRGFWDALERSRR
jgi:hypothetical protein